jgi:hypothetical protein
MVTALDLFGLVGGGTLFARSFCALFFILFRNSSLSAFPSLN